MELRPPVPAGLRVVATFPFVDGPRQAFPLLLARAACGFPSPADDAVDRALDLHELCVANPPATYFVRVEGDSMVDVGIHSGDVLVVDRSVEATDGRVVVAALNGEVTVKRLRMRGGRVWLSAESAGGPALEVGPDADLEICGVVTFVVHAVR